MLRVVGVDGHFNDLYRGVSGVECTDVIDASLQHATQRHMLMQSA